ncbi:Secreted protein [Colletotrichum asianum]
MKLTLGVACLSLASLAAADWRFRSRPELAAPRLNITVPADRRAVEKGFIFVAPYEGFEEGHHGPVQPGAYIFRDDGELVWSGIGHHSGRVANFRPDTWNGKPYLRAFQGSLDGKHGRMFGYHTLLGPDYEVAKVVKVGSHRLVSAHEFRLVDGKTALVETPIPRTVSLKPWGGTAEQNWILSGGFQEIDIDTGDVIFEWESFDHVDPKYSAFPLDFGPGLLGSGTTETDAWNYFHINSIDKDDEGNYLISARNAAAVFKINGTSGEIIWQLGGFHGGSSFTLASEDVFGYQHHARFRSRSAGGKIEIISLFDNGAHSAPEKTNAFSRGRIYQLNHTDGTAKAIQTYDAPDGLSAHTQGSSQTLPNNNIFINWGQSGAVTEYSHEGKVLFHAYLDSAPEGIFTQSYRGFRYNWTGTPAEEPAIVAFKGTQTAGSKEDLLGEVEREGFETHAKFRRVAVADDVAIIAEAVGKDGRALRKTRPVPISFDLANPPSEPKWGSDEL